ncbi:hypothetical protein Tco_1573581 [Tanacetum coccineum]
MSIWKEFVCDVRNRNCLFNADADECLKMIIVGVKKELDQLDDLANGNSSLFKDAEWKILFSNDLKTSFGKLKCSRMKKQVLNLLLKLFNGWRPKSRSIELRCETKINLTCRYMKERDWLNEKHPYAFPSFSELARHHVLCPKLKQLYVAITRTRQRLWICEHKEEMSKPMLVYRKKRGLVQVRKLDDSVDRAMRVTSSPQD